MNNLCCPCCFPVSTIRHCLCVCPLLRDYEIRIRKDLCLDPYCRKGVIAIVNDLLDWTLNNTKTGGIRRMDATWSLNNFVIPLERTPSEGRKALAFERNVGLPSGDRSNANSSWTWPIPYTSTRSDHWSVPSFWRWRTEFVATPYLVAGTLSQRLVVRLGPFLG